MAPAPGHCNWREKLPARASPLEGARLSLTGSEMGVKRPRGTDCPLQADMSGLGRTCSSLVSGMDMSVMRTAGGPTYLCAFTRFTFSTPPR